MRRWKCVESRNTEEMKVGNIVVTDNNGRGGKWLTGQKMTFPIWEYTECLGCSSFEEIKEFTKDDLEPCMVVKIRDGRLGVVVNTTDGLAVSFENDRWCGINSYNDDMTHDVNKIDIIEVYGFSKNAYSNLAIEISTNNRELLYRREEKSEKDLEIERLESEMRDMADRIAKLKGE